MSSSISTEKATKHELTNRKSVPKLKTISKPLTIPHFYPEVPVQDETLSLPKKKAKKKKSKTKQLLLDALTSSRKQIGTISKEIKDVSSKKRQKSSRMTKRQRREIEIDRTIDLTQFISEETPNVKTEKYDVHSQKIETKPTTRSKIPLLNESDQFPFTTLSEWLIWHSNFPELAFVREAHDLDAIPIDSDEVFWINVMNEPEFFNSDWKMAGSIIHDLNLAKRQGPPSGSPDFDMDLVLTEGFSTLFTDIYLILTKMPSGLKNYRFPVLQLALKGLLLLDLVYLDQGNWFAKESEEELVVRVKKLDEFIKQQEVDSDYGENVKSLIGAQNWQKGIVCFDLLISKSIYISTFSQTHLTEKSKISMLTKDGFNQSVLSNLEEVRFMDELRVKGLSAQLSK
ncbi:MAG: hypothetical protein ACW98I_04875 [Candidatus Hodarchaeales archaeon]|jgi:hypothetical protein